MGVIVAGLSGIAPRFGAEPVAWTFERADGGRSFYTSLGYETDFDAARQWVLAEHRVLDGADPETPNGTPTA